MSVWKKIKKFFGIESEETGHMNDNAGFNARAGSNHRCIEREGEFWCQELRQGNWYDTCGPFLNAADCEVARQRGCR